MKNSTRSKLAALWMNWRLGGWTTAVVIVLLFAFYAWRENWPAIQRQLENPAIIRLDDNRDYIQNRRHPCGYKMAC